MTRSQSRALTPRRWSRRTWLLWPAVTVLAVRGAQAQQLPPGVGVAATPPCDPSTTPTPARAVAGFAANAPRRTSIDGAGRRLLLTGSVAGVRCGLIAGAVVDLWHATATGVVRARQSTSADGGYHVETTVPVARTGEAPRLNVRVEVPGKATFVTCMFLPAEEAGAANAADRAHDARLTMTLLDRTPARLRASFNVILDL